MQKDKVKIFLFDIIDKSLADYETVVNITAPSMKLAKKLLIERHKLEYSRILPKGI